MKRWVTALLAVAVAAGPAMANTLTQNLSWTIDRAGTTTKYRVTAYGDSIYAGYYGSLGVYPGEVFHNVLGGVSPVAGAILRRFAKITGDELVVTLTSGNPQSTNATTVRLRRLSGADDMLPRGR